MTSKSADEKLSKLEKQFEDMERLERAIEQQTNLLGRKIAIAKSVLRVRKKLTNIP